MLQDEFEMENQGYEEEPSTRPSPQQQQQQQQQQPPTHLGKRQCFSKAYPTIVENSRSSPIVANPGSRSDSESHVYEDIVVFSGFQDSTKNAQDICLPTIVTNNNNGNDSENDRKNAHRIGLSINGVNSSTPDESENWRNFHKNLTLPLRRAARTIDGAENPSRFSVRVTDRERARCLAIANESPRIEDETTNNVVEKSGRRRRKKDCKHCKTKSNCTAARIITANNETIAEQNEKMTLGFAPLSSCRRIDSIFSISNNANGLCTANGPKPLNYDKNDTDLRIVAVRLSEESRLPTLVAPHKNRLGIKVNSIYSHEEQHRISKDLPIFVTDVNEESSPPFQRAYSLPTRTHQTPSSQNRANLRRSVRGEPAPHPARLRKNRHGWTLDFARPLDGTGCTRSIVVLLIAILALLGIGGIALYIVFEPEKLEIIQQYLRSSGANVSSDSNATFENGLLGGIEASSSEATTLSIARVFFTELTPETEAIPTPNVTRHCDDCYNDEVCVALVDEQVPICRNGPDPRDPTGCAGLCLINEQKCHRLDVDAFRCVEVEHYCLDDEWTCSNTLCIPLVKHCDGHMNCYDHSDEYDCDCDRQTHFQCGNETSCLPLERRCDGKIDCWDATDEINCTLACPSSSEFTCSNGECIPKARFCDGLGDCTDGSDEPHGCQGRCNKHEFSCLNGRCITKGMKCNGIDDCDDGSDEQHCRDPIFKKPVSNPSRRK